jgi:hypothetical protein
VLGEIVGVLDPEDTERDLRQERRVRRAELELDRQPVERRDLLDGPGVRILAAGGLAGLGVDHAVVGRL